MKQDLNSYIAERLRESSTVWEAIGPDGVQQPEGETPSLAIMMQGLFLGVLIRNAILSGDCNAVGRAVVAQVKSYLANSYDLERIDDVDIYDQYEMRVEEDTRRAREER